jgi:hypothetical protein
MSIKTLNCRKLQRCKKRVESRRRKIENIVHLRRSSGRRNLHI